MARSIVAVAVLGVVVACVPALAAEPERMCFIGESVMGSGDGRPMGSQVLLVEKTHDPAKGTITERAVVVKADGSSESHAMTMTVSGDTFTIADDARTITGSGKLFGPAWRWTYFCGTFKSSNGVTIEDENFLADPSVGVARKKVTAPDGKVIMYMDVTLKAVTPQTFKILSAALLKK